jgi:hypothetical protein
VTVRVVIDPNVRVRGNQTFTELGAIIGDAVCVGQQVVAFETESGLAGVAVVTDIDPERHLVYLAVDWRSFREPNASTI